MLLEVQGIVLRRTKYGEGSLIADLLTKEHGLVTIIAQGIQSKSGRAKDALLQVGAVIEAVLYFKPGGNMHRMKSVHPALRLSDIPFNFIKGSILLFSIELSRNALLKSGIDEQHFDLLKNQILLLDQLKKGLAFFPIQFTLRLAQSLGFGIDWDSYHEGSFLDLQAGTFISNIPSHPNYLSQYYAYRYYLLGARKDNSQKVTKKDRQYLLDQSMVFYKLHIDQFRIPNSLDILTTIFNDS
jgi:DNA repair protein RecO (recombination protein O)